MFIYKVEDNKYFNIKELLKSYYEMSDKLISKLKRYKRIYKNDLPVYVTEKLSIGDIVKIDLIFEEESDNILPIKREFSILYEDEYMLIINKEPGFPVHPSSSHREDSLSNFVKYYFESKNIKCKLRPVNRLDKDTSGIVIFAKLDYIQECLIKQMQKNILKKEYLAILENVPSPLFGTISAPIARKEGSIIEREICFEERPHLSIDYKPTFAETIYKVQKIYENKINNINLSLTHFTLLTGRTHQIRLHSRYIGAPILGDSLYNKKSDLITRQALHSYKITFIHPITKQEMILIAPIPKDMEHVLNKFEFKNVL